MEQQISELTDQMSRLHDEGIQLETDLEENQSEKSVKYRDLKKREENMDSVSNKHLFFRQNSKFYCYEIKKWIWWREG